MLLWISVSTVKQVKSKHCSIHTHEGERAFGVLSKRTVCAVKNSGLHRDIRRRVRADPHRHGWMMIFFHACGKYELDVFICIWLEGITSVLIYPNLFLIFFFKKLPSWSVSKWMEKLWRKEKSQTTSTEEVKCCWKFALTWTWRFSHSHLPLARLWGLSKHSSHEGGLVKDCVSRE